jgi:hypothetical protein
MPTKMSADMLPLLAVLALTLPAKAVAGPPEVVSGKMVFDEVADRLRKCRKEKDEGRTMALLRNLAPTNDPRVAVALGELLSGRDEEVGSEATLLLRQGFRFDITSNRYREMARAWWKKNEADLRRRAKQLPK